MVICTQNGNAMFDVMMLHVTVREKPQHQMVLACLQSLFPQDLVDHERIRAQFTSALNSMNHAVEGRSVPAWQQAHMEAQPQAAPGQPSSYSAYAAPGPAMQAPGQYMPAEEDLTLRQLVESFAAENDIQLLPKVGQLEEGLQVGLTCCNLTHGVLMNTCILLLLINFCCCASSVFGNYLNLSWSF